MGRGSNHVWLTSCCSFARRVVLVQAYSFGRRVQAGSALHASPRHQASLTVLTRRGAWRRVGGGTLSEPPVIYLMAMGPVGLILSNGAALATRTARPTCSSLERSHINHQTLTTESFHTRVPTVTSSNTPCSLAVLSFASATSSPFASATSFHLYHYVFPIPRATNAI